MKRVYLLFGAIIAMSICDLFFIRRSTEGLQLGVMGALVLLYLVCLVMVMFKKNVTWGWRLGVVAVALLAMSLYFKTIGLRNSAAFHIAFAMHHDEYTTFAKLLNQKSDSLVKVMKAKGTEHIYVNDIMDVLNDDAEVNAMREKTGVRSFWMLELKKDGKDVDDKFAPEFTLINSAGIYGIQYNPGNYTTDFSPSAQRRTITRHDSDWQFWQSSGGGFGGFM